MRFLHDLLQGRGSIIGFGIVAIKELFGSHHDLIRGFSAATAATHAIGQNCHDAAVDARVLEQRELVLLVFSVAFVNAGRSGKSVTSGHGALLEKQYFLQKSDMAVLSSQHDLLSQVFCSAIPLILLVTNLHSPERHMIELRMEHADLDALIDRAVELAPVDELMIRRLKKRRLALRDEIARVERELQPDEPA